MELLLGCDDVFVRLDETDLDAEDFDVTEELADDVLRRLDWLLVEELFDEIVDWVLERVDWLLLLGWEVLAELLVLLLVWLLVWEVFEELLI